MQRKRDMSKQLMRDETERLVKEEVAMRAILMLLAFGFALLAVRAVMLADCITSN